MSIVKDPRHARGIRHPLVIILALALGAVAAGARSFTAISEWANDVGPAVLQQVGLEGAIPSESTIRRVMGAMDSNEVSLLFGEWTQVRLTETDGHTVMALDGKTLRGARHGEHPAPQLVAALSHNSGLVLGQMRVPDGSSEVPTARDLLTLFDLKGVVVTMDAAHTVKTTARQIIDQGGHYVLTVKNNNRILKRQLKDLKWGQIAGTSTTERGHGRRVTRTIKAFPTPPGIDFANCAQVLQLRRTVTAKNKRTVEVVYLVSSLSPTEATPAQIGAMVQGHWGVEVRLHLIRDLTWDEDRSQVRTGNAPAMMAVLRNMAITLLRLLDWDNIAAATRHLARDHHRAGRLLLTS